VHGGISTLSGIYAQNNKLDLKKLTGSSKWTLIATGGVMVVCGVLFLFYKLMVKHVQKKHDKEYGKRGTGTHGEGTGHENEKPPKLRNTPQSYASSSTVYLGCRWSFM